MLRTGIPLLALLATACDTARETAEPTEIRAAVSSLMDAPSGKWPEPARRLLAIGAPAAELLGSELQSRPDAPGSQCALAIFAEIRGADAAPFLTSWLREARPHGDEAALALGQIGARSEVDLLASVSEDRDRPILTRTAAAAALLDLGDAARSVPMLCAVLTAGTPQGRSGSEEFGIPDKPRWALERRIAIDAIRRHAGHDFGLDADSPWPRLAAAVSRCRAALLAESK